MLKYAQPLILIFYFLIHIEVDAQWMQANGPYGGNIKALARIGNHLFAGSATAGVFVSTNNGKDWVQTSTKSMSPFISSLAVIDSILFAGTTSDGVLYSSNFGESWTKTAPLFQVDGQSERINCLLVSGNKLYAGTSQGVYQTTDQGFYWSKVNPLYPLENIHSIAVKDTMLFTETQYDAYRSSLNGSKWFKVLPGYPYIWVNALAAKDSFLFAGTRNGLFLSSDNGNSWIKAGAGIGDSEITALAFTGEDLLAGTYKGGAYSSSDNGKSWKQIGLEGENIVAFLSNGPNLYAGTYPHGVLFSDNKGANWTASRLLNSNVMALTASGNYLVAGADGVYISSNNGIDWNTVRNGLPDNSYAYKLASDGNIIAAAFVSHAVYVSNDNGLSWTSTGLMKERIKSIAVNGKNIFVGTYDGLFISTNCGNTWFQPKNGLPDNYVARDLAISGNNLVALIYDSTGNKVYFSPDNGASWSSIGLEDYYPVAVAAAGADIFAATQVHGVFLSRDNGKSWTQKKNGLEPVSSMQYHLEVKDSSIFFQTLDCIYLSTDYGDSWRKVNTGLSEYTQINSMAVFNNNLYIGTEGMGVWMCPLSGRLTSIGVQPENFPSGFCLGQNYPNPFNPETTINYSTTEWTHVEVKVFDMLGREIQTLVNKEQGAGSYEVQFNASAFPSGMYIYSIHAGQFRDSKKLLLIK